MCYSFNYTILIIIFSGFLEKKRPAPQLLSASFFFSWSILLSVLRGPGFAQFVQLLLIGNEEEFLCRSGTKANLLSKVLYEFLEEIPLLKRYLNLLYIFAGAENEHCSLSHLVFSSFSLYKGLYFEYVLHFILPCFKL